MATITFTKSTNKIQINNYVEDNPGRYLIDINSAPLVVVIGETGFNIQFNLNEDDVVINGVDFSGTAQELKASLLSDVFTIDVSSRGSGIFTKSDDAAAFAALSNGQWNLYEVGGEVSIYAKSSDGTQKMLTL